MAGFFRKFTKRFFILANAAIALLYLAGCLAPILDSEKFWWIGVLTLGAPLLIILLLGFIIFWLVAKWRWMFISIIALAVGWKTTKVTVGLHPFGKNEKTSANSIKIASWNVHLFDYYHKPKEPSLRKEMIALLNKEIPDIACFQEFLFTQKNNNRAYSMDSFTTQLGMPYYVTITHPLDSLVLKDYPALFGKVIFSRYPIVNSKQVFYNSQNYNHCFVYADIALPTGTVRVFNIHLQSLYFNEKDYAFVDDINLQKENIEAESKSILRKLKNGFIKRALQADTISSYINKSPYPVIVCGDFNDVPGSYAYFKVRGNLNDAFEKAGWGFGRTFSRISPTLRIDNIFTDKKFVIDAYKRIEKNFSDHYPILAEISLNK